MGKTLTDKKGELRERFYMSLKRSSNESVINFALRYRTLVSEMRAEGITLDDAESAWFYKQKLSLTEVQKQMLETTLGASTESYAECEKESVRLFKRIHMVGTPTPWKRPLGRPKVVCSHGGGLHLRLRRRCLRPLRTSRKVLA